MDFFIKSLYSLLFGVVAYTLFLIISKAATNWKSLAIVCLLCLTSILAIDKFSNASAFVPSTEIYLLVKFDFGLVILYVMSKWQLASFRNKPPGELQLLAKALSHTVGSIQDFLIKYAIFVMVYLYQLVSIWLLTEHYLIEANWR
ncbi:MAG: hypothetical protein ACRYFX_23835 [Janthinobacterium lividum]